MYQTYHKSKEEPLLQAGSEERPQGFREVHQGQEGEEEIPQSALDYKDWSSFPRTWFEVPSLHKQPGQVPGGAEQESSG